MLVYVKAILRWMGLQITGAIPVYVDNHIFSYRYFRNDENSTRTNHINVNIQYVREMINNRTIELRKIFTGYNVADLHTKSLAGHVFKNHRGKIMNGFGGDPANIHRYMDEYA